MVKTDCASFIIFRQRSELINLQRSENNLFLNLIMQIKDEFSLENG